MAYSQEVAEVNDRVSRLAARLGALDGLMEDHGHPAVVEAAASAAVVMAALEQQRLAQGEGAELGQGKAPTMVQSESVEVGREAAVGRGKGRRSGR